MLYKALLGLVRALYGLIGTIAAVQVSGAGPLGLFTAIYARISGLQAAQKGQTGVDVTVIWSMGNMHLGHLAPRLAFERALHQKGL